MAGQRELNGIIAKARSEAFKVVCREINATLPEGWAVYLAVGWGLTVYDADRTTIMGLYESPPDRLPKGLRAALRLAADFMDTFGAGNESFYGKKK